MGTQHTTQAPDWISQTLAPLPAVVTTDEAIGVLRMTRRHLYRIIAAGRLHAVKSATGASARLLIPKASLEKYLRRLDGAE